jgi:hypothetical protein
LLAKILMVLTNIINATKIQYMRHTFAIRWMISPLAAFAVTTSALAVDTVETIEGDRYENIKILKMESDGVIVKHSEGIAKIPFYELDEETLTALGHTGEATPPIRHSSPPDPGLLGEIDGVDVAIDDLDLDAEPESEEAEEPTTAQMVAVPAKVKTVTSTTVKPRVRKVRPQVKVGASAIGVSAWLKSPKIASQYVRHNHGNGACGCGDYPTITTRYTPYGNFSYVGRPAHWYGYYNPPCNRCRFEKVDYRRWQGRR